MIHQSTRPALHSSLGITASAALLVMLAGCAPGNPLDADGPAGDDTPFEQRQTAEEYAAILPPAILQLQEELTQAGSGPWKRSDTRYQFEIHHCREDDGKNGHQIRTAPTNSGPLSVETVTQISTEILAPLGYRMSVTEYDGIDITWLDWRNGGYIWISIQPETIGISGRSECRPGTDFEGTRAKLRALLPLATETPENTPTPTKERQRPTRHQNHDAQINTPPRPTTAPTHTHKEA